ncbi:ComEC/Rec2 family competence protein [Candidatus Parcubacteria bacterium]|nr:MAG: ComEC/Rec2 family competence protein [Candidatus Parcubacteria bacterium]
MTPSRWLFISTFAVCAGITLGYPGVSIWLKAAWLIFLLVWVIIWRAGLRGIFCSLLLIGLIFLRTQQALNFPKLVKSDFTGRGSVKNITLKSTNRQQLIIELEKGFRVLATIQDREIKINDTLEVFCREISEPKLTPAQIRRERISGFCANPRVKVIAAASFNYRDLIWQGRMKFIKSLQKVLPFQEASLAAGMTIGETSFFSQTSLDEFRRTGLSHLIAVSGQNLSLILILFIFVFNKYFPKIIRIGLISVLAFSFVILTGGEASILRAAVMAILALAIQNIGRPVSGLNVLFAAAAVLLIINPTLLWDNLGFQLSFGATFGLIAFSQPFQIWLARLPKFVREVLSATLAATCGTLPVVLINFQQISIISPITNLIVVPLVPWIMGLVSFVGLANLVWPPTAQLVGLATWGFLKFVELVSVFGSRLPGASLIMPLWLAVTLVFAIVLVLRILFGKYVKPLFD